MNPEFWNEVFGAEDYVYGTAPNVFLTSWKQLLEAGQRALAVADGEGRNGVWLAEQGLDVLSVDMSDVGLKKAQALARERGVTIRTECANLKDWAWPEAEFDVIVSIFAHFPPDIRHEIHRKMVAALRPGGCIILQAYTPRQVEYGTGGPPSAELMYSLEIMLEDFGDLDILHLREHDAEIEEGVKHRGMSALVELVACTEE